MPTKKVVFQYVDYTALNSRQRENYNFQKVSAVLADYGFTTMRLSSDWKGADFIADHVNGEVFLKVQLKGVLTADAKYQGKDIWICFRRKDVWYLYPHDDFLQWALMNSNIANTKGWKVSQDGKVQSGVYTWPSPNKKIMTWLQGFALRGK